MHLEGQRYSTGLKKHLGGGMTKMCSGPDWTGRSHLPCLMWEVGWNTGARGSCHRMLGRDTFSSRVSVGREPVFRSLRGRLHAQPTCMPTLHLPWWSCCSSQQWASCKAKAALDRWCSPSSPRANGSPPSSRASSGGHRYRGHCVGKSNSWSADLLPPPLC